METPTVRACALGSSSNGSAVHGRPGDVFRRDVVSASSTSVRSCERPRRRPGWSGSSRASSQIAHTVSRKSLRSPAAASAAARELFTVGVMPRHVDAAGLAAGDGGEPGSTHADDDGGAPAGERDCQLRGRGSATRAGRARRGPAPGLRVGEAAVGRIAWSTAGIQPTSECRGGTGPDAEVEAGVRMGPHWRRLTPAPPAWVADVGDHRAELDGRRWAASAGSRGNALNSDRPGPRCR